MSRSDAHRWTAAAFALAVICLAGGCETEPYDAAYYSYDPFYEDAYAYHYYYYPSASYTVFYCTETRDYHWCEHDRWYVDRRLPAHVHCDTLNRVTIACNDNTPRRYVDRARQLARERGSQPGRRDEPGGRYEPGGRGAPQHIAPLARADEPGPQDRYDTPRQWTGGVDRRRDDATDRRDYRGDADVRHDHNAYDASAHRAAPPQRTPEPVLRRFDKPERPIYKNDSDTVVDRERDNHDAARHEHSARPDDAHAEHDRGGKTAKSVRTRDSDDDRDKDKDTDVTRGRRPTGAPAGDSPRQRKVRG
ncbi:MAG: hypothetical protein GC159_04695 [Phycisphaera sp.]|nr:hypothetical protein [Phycisphaera sp.]